MRRIALTALLLSPVVLHAQANLSNGNHALLHKPALSALGAASREGEDAKPSRTADTTAVTADTIQTVITTHVAAAEELAEQQNDMGPQHSFLFNGSPEAFEAPKLMHWARIECVQGELEAADASSKKLLLTMVISQSGMPTEIKVVHSVDPVLDRKAVEALSQYRFTPALLAHRPAAAPAEVAINFPAR